MRTYPPFPAANEDVAAAVKFLQNSGAQYGINPVFAECFSLILRVFQVWSLHFFAHVQCLANRSLCLLMKRYISSLRS